MSQDFDLVIRPARTSDAVLIHALIKSSLESSTVLNKEAKKDLARKFDLSALHDLLAKDDSIILVAVGANESINATVLMSIEGGMMHLSQLVVRENYRRQGIGSLFIREVLKIAKQLAVHRVTGYTRSNDIGAQVLASREGFAICGHCPNFWYLQDYVLWSRSV